LSNVSDEELWSELSGAADGRRGEILLELAERCYQRGDSKQYETLVEVAAQAAAEAKDDRLSAFAHFNLGQGQFESGRFADASESFLTAASYFHVMGEHADVAQSHMRAADSYSSLGQPERALNHWRTALALYESEEDFINTGRAWMLVGGEQMALSHIADAEESFLTARGAFRLAKSAVHVAWADDAAAEALIQQGRPDEAVPMLRSCLDVAQVGNDDSALAYAQLRLGAALRMVGDADDSLRLLEAASVNYQKADDLLGVARSHLEQGHAHRALAQGAQATDAYQRARSIFDAIGADSYVLFVDRSRTELHLDLGEYAEAEVTARDYLRTAIQSGQQDQIEDAAIMVATSLLELGQHAAAMSVVSGHFGTDGEPTDRLVVPHLVTWARILAANGHAAEAEKLTDALLSNPDLAEEPAVRAQLHEARWLLDSTAPDATHHLTSAIALYLATGSPTRAEALTEHLLTGAPAQIDLRTSRTATVIAGGAFEA